MAAKSDAARVLMGRPLASAPMAMAWVHRFKGSEASRSSLRLRRPHGASIATLRNRRRDGDDPSGGGRRTNDCPRCGPDGVHGTHPAEALDRTRRTGTRPSTPCSRLQGNSYRLGKRLPSGSTIADADDNVCALSNIESPAQLSARHTGSPHGTPPCLPLRLIRHRRRRSVRVSMCRSEQTPFEPVAYPANHFGPTRWPRRASIAAGMDHRTISAMRRGAIGSALACCPQPPVFAVSNAGSASSSHQCSRLGKGPIVATRSTP